MGQSRYRHIGVACLMAIMLQASPGLALGASIADISVTNSQKDLLLYLKVKDAFTEPIHEAVSSGVPTTFSFFIVLEEIRYFWANRTLSEMTLTHTIKYYNLKKEFTVTRSWEADPSVPLMSFDEAKGRMTRIDGVKVIPLDRLRKGNAYRIRVKAKLSKMTLPFYLRYIMVMASMWEFETDWHAVDFTY
ncbi:hypothetical protein B2D07_05275 [Desulfococcus multivorans]|jgi:hypothetical protein|uniref:DUF4390 domain-containing protein n=2 Tax=Desulfococcus multivorans TaxID=897 RepID=S7V2Q5_DESML|nr:conserved uncharacterized protein [Desulfococcus multivorans]AQV00240.1 hypothetical protein B2D07_05275 [Desulfococcus multivorans]EPR38943.1 Protein of unknown function DUF4390 [Desulfococcus multivorans DSM 2059]SJZ66769.1 protein of unknown function [Desulfococcus multivorans DSM 2059]